MSAETIVWLVLIGGALLAVRLILAEARRDMESKCDTWPNSDELGRHL